jgi:ABC-type uncharacterized transport system ATPase subunit
LSSVTGGVVSVVLEGERVDQEFEFSFSIANEDDLAAVDEKLQDLVRGRSLTMVATLVRPDTGSLHVAGIDLRLSDDADRLVRTYSGGMRRRLDLGASLVGAPRLLLLDEPTTGLDPRSRNDLWDAIRDLVATGTDVLLTTQYLDEADQLAHDIVIIDHGTVIAAGTPAELKNRAGRDVIEIHVRDTRAVDAAASALRRLDDEPRVDPATRRISLAVDAGTDRLTDAVRVLDALGIAVEDIALRRPTLDEVFLALTGQPTAAPDLDPDPQPSPHRAAA